ncbi:GAF domain-containing protein [Marinithermus hydrothermalis]|uniref:GAF domain-containing protein n=1 Tax=Marinithermus hydrothermalis TaxID=186192 RepID=UPI0002D2D465|nr:GAF domain-containing protein [Marinithermus hydrothermalis]
MFRKRRRYQEPVDILAEFNEALLSSLELRPVLRHLLEAALETLNAERTAVFLYRSETDELRGEVATGRGQNYTVSAIALPVRTPGAIQDAFFAPPEGFLQDGEYLVPIIEQEAPAGGRPLCWIDPPQRCNLTPRITYEDRPKICPRCPHFGSLGVLSVEGRLEEEAEHLLPVMARSTALAVRNARVFEEVQLHREELSRHAQQLELINDLARKVIRNLNLADILRTLAARLHKDFGYYRVTIAINQNGTLRGYLTLVEGREYWTRERTRIHIPITQSDDPFARAARSRRPVIAQTEDLPPLGGRHLHGVRAHHGLHPDLRRRRSDRRGGRGLRAKRPACRRRGTELHRDPGEYRWHRDQKRPSLPGA